MDNRMCSFNGIKSSCKLKADWECGKCHYVYCKYHWANHWCSGPVGAPAEEENPDEMPF